MTTGPVPTSGSTDPAVDTPVTAGRDQSVDAPATTTTAKPAKPVKDPLRGSRASGTWVALSVLVVLLVLIATFVMQNTDRVQINFLTWSGEAPLAAVLLIAAAGGMLLTLVAGTLRILQLRHRVRREAKKAKKQK